MRPILIALNHRLTSEPFDTRVGQLIGYLAGICHRPRGGRGFGQAPWEPSRVPPRSRARLPAGLALCDAGDALPPRWWGLGTRLRCGHAGPSSPAMQPASES